MRGAALEIVHVYEPPVEQDTAVAHAGAFAGTFVGTPSHVQPLRTSHNQRAERWKHARRRAEGVIEELLWRARVPVGVTVKRTVLADRRPAKALLATGAGAELLVVGSRGLGGARGLFLGSVGQQLAHHAPCPLVIVPGDHRAGR